MGMIKVLHITPFGKMGGVQNRLIDFFAKTVPKFQFYVFSPAPIPKLWQQRLTEVNIPFYQAADQKTALPDLIRYVHEKGIVIAHFHRPWPEAKKQLKNRVKVIIEHDHGIIWGSPYKIKKYLKNKDAVDGVITVSDASRILFKKRLNYEAAKLTTIHNGVNFRHLKANNPVPKNGKKIISTICRLKSLKGVATLIKAIPIVLSKRKDVEFWIIGAGNARSDLEKLGLSLGVSDYIKFWGIQKSVANFLVSTDVFILPSIREPFGGVLIEAGYFAKPVIAANVDGNAEIVIDKKTGILINPTLRYQKSYVSIDGNSKRLRKPASMDPNILGAILIDLLQQPKKCKALGEKARNRVIKLFNIERYRQNIIKYYLKVLKAKKA